MPGSAGGTAGSQRGSVLLGQGAGGAALALLPADQVIATRHAWIAPLPPEGASDVLFGITRHAAEMARAQCIRAAELDDLVDVVVDDDGPRLPAIMARKIERLLQIAAAEPVSEPRTPQVPSGLNPTAAIV